MGHIAHRAEVEWRANKEVVEWGTERGASQPLAAQVLHARGEREGRGVDGGRGGVLQAPPAARRAHAPAAAARRVLPPRLALPLRPVLAHPAPLHATRPTLYTYTPPVTLSFVFRRIQTRTICSLQ